MSAIDTIRRTRTVVSMRNFKLLGIFTSVESIQTVETLISMESINIFVLNTVKYTNLTSDNNIQQ